jgi:hypothetical protein
MNGRILRTTTDVIDALGGNGAVQAIVPPPPGKRRKRKAPPKKASRQRVSNWRRFTTFPAYTYGALSDALLALGKRAPRSLWGMGDGMIGSTIGNGPREGARTSA